MLHVRVVAHGIRVGQFQLLLHPETSHVRLEAAHLVVHDDLGPLELFISRGNGHIPRTDVNHDVGHAGTLGIHNQRLIHQRMLLADLGVFVGIQLLGLGSLAVVNELSLQASPLCLR